MASGPPAHRTSSSGGSAWIADERDAPGLPPWWMVLLALFMGAAVATIAIVLGGQRTDALTGEALAMDGNGLWPWIADVFGLEGARIVSGLAAGATVAAVALLVRRFSHSDGAGLAAAALVAMDPALLLEGQLALPHAMLRAMAVGALALALADQDASHWFVFVPLAIGGAIDPRFLLWGIGIAALLMVRGHIYAAPKHLRAASLQAVVLPALVALPFHAVARSLGDVNQLAGWCSSTWRTLVLAAAPDHGPSAVAVANPVVALGGMALLLGLGVFAMLHVGTNFRISREPGRVQLRLPRRLARLPSRSLWLLLLAALVPVPSMWTVLGAVAMVLAVMAMAEETPGFAVIIIIILLAFTALALAQLAPLVDPDATSGQARDAMRLIPWLERAPCTP